MLKSRIASFASGLNPPNPQLLYGLAVLSVLAWCGGRPSLNQADPDLWGHIQYGRDVLCNGEIAATTTYSYTADGYRWINHENFSEVAFAVLESLGGATALLIAKFMLGIGTLAIMFRVMERQNVGFFSRGAILLLVAYNLVHHWSMRPQLATYTSYVLMLALLHWCFQGWQGRWYFTHSPSDISYSSKRLRCLWGLPVLMFVWANSHGGFIAGYAILVAYLVGRSCEAFWVRGGMSWPLQRRLIMMVLASGLATLVNPYGPRLHIWLLESLGRPRPEIMEWLPPTFADPLSLPYWLMSAFCLLTLFASRRSRDATHLLILAVTAWQAFLHQRHAAFFAIACGFYLGPHLDSVVRSFDIEGRCQRLFSTSKPILRWGLAVALFLLLGCETYRISSRLVDMPVHFDRYPCAALQFMADHDMHGNMVVPYRWSQYVIAAFGDPTGPVHVRVAFDGRYRTCYPQALVDTYFDFAVGMDGPLKRYRHPDSPPYDPLRILNYAPPDETPPNLVLVDVNQPHSVKVMKSVDNEWTVLFQNGVCQLWARRAIFDAPDSVRYVPPAARVHRDQPLDCHIAWPALPVFRSPNVTVRNALLCESEVAMP